MITSVFLISVFFQILILEADFFGNELPDYEQFSGEPDLYGWDIEQYPTVPRDIKGKNDGRAWTLEEPEGILTTLAGPSGLDCFWYKYAGVKCYPDIGCFGHGHTLLDYLCRLPEKDIKVTYKVYTKSNRIGSVIEAKEESFANFLPNAKTVFYFHGFFQSATQFQAIKVKDAILNFSDYQQVVLIDYEWAVRGINYHRAMANTDFIGRSVGHMINLLASYRSLDPPKNVYFIAHSLGAPVAHLASKFLIKSRGVDGKIARMTMLDPPAPLTSGCSHCGSLTEDAHFVDVIHSSAGYDDKNIVWSYKHGRIGLTKPLGHVDFYPNGGGTQLACGLITSITNPGSFCAHAQSVEFYTKSFRNCDYKSVHCQSVNVLKEGPKSCKRGNGYGSRMGYYANVEKGKGIQYVEMSKDC